jgi:hypothetical protein
MSTDVFSSMDPTSSTAQNKVLIGHIIMCYYISLEPCIPGHRWFFTNPDTADASLLVTLPTLLSTWCTLLFVHNCSVQSCLILTLIIRCSLNPPAAQTLSFSRCQNSHPVSLHILLLSLLYRQIVSYVHIWSFTVILQHSHHFYRAHACFYYGSVYGLPTYTFSPDNLAWCG